AARDWKRLLAISRLADPDPLRHRLREALEKEDIQTLVALAARDVHTLPATSLDLLASALSRSRRFTEAWSLLQKARRLPPRDFWINQHPALYLRSTRPPDLDGAIRYYTVGVTLRPQSPGAHLSLGLALRLKGALDEALGEFRKAQE